MTYKMEWISGCGVVVCWVRVLADCDSAPDREWRKNIMLAIAPGQGTQRHLLRDTEEGLRVAFIGHVVQRVTEHQQSLLHLSASPGSEGDWKGTHGIPRRCPEPGVCFHGALILQPNGTPFSERMEFCPQVSNSIPASQAARVLVNLTGSPGS